MDKQFEGDLRYAEQTYLELLRENPDLSDACHLLGLVRAAQERNEEAIDLIEKAIRLNTQAAAYHHNIAGIYRRLGWFVQAETGFRRAIELKADYGEAYQGLFEVVRCEASESILSKLRAQLDNAALDEQSHSYMHFAAGKVCDDAGDFERAFSHYLKGNKLAGKSFDCTRNESFFKDIVYQYGPELMTKSLGTGHLSDQPVFIVGMPRSGTSLVEQILASHSGIFGAGELHDLGWVINSATRQSPDKLPFPYWLADIKPASFRLMGETYLARLAAHGGDGQYSRIVVKHPLNFQFLGIIRQILPNAKILHITRNAMDTCLSCFFENFTKGQDYSFDLRSLGIFYNQYRRLMSHWKSLLLGLIHEVNYERLQQDPETEIKEMLQFCNLEFENHC